MKKLIGNNDIEDALKRLDRLTQEETRMASAQLLEVTNAIDSEVGEIASNVLVVDDRVAGVDNRVKAVDAKLVAVIDGAQYIFYLLPYNFLTYSAPRWKRGQGSYPTSC